MIAAASRCSASRTAASSSGSASGSSPPWSPLVQHTSQPWEPASIQRAAVAAGPKSASSGWATMSRNRSGRQAWSRGASGSFTSARPDARVWNETVAAAMARKYICARGFARLPPRAKPPALSGSPADGAQLVERLQDGGGMTLGLDLRPDARDPPVWGDQERRADDPPVAASIVQLLAPGPVGVGGVMTLVGQQGERELELLPEGALAG